MDNLISEKLDTTARESFETRTNFLKKRDTEKKRKKAKRKRQKLSRKINRK